MPTETLTRDEIVALIRRERERPPLVHQRNVEAVVGLPHRDYLRHGREGAWPTTHDRRLVVARTSDVLAWYEARIAIAERQPVNDTDPEAIAFGRVGARRVSR